MEMLYIFIGLYVILGREKCMGVCDNIIKALTDTSSGKNNDDSKVDFDL
jgi:sulfite exporter TauE/SafE